MLQLQAFFCVQQRRRRESPSVIKQVASSEASARRRLSSAGRPVGGLRPVSGVGEKDGKMMTRCGKMVRRRRSCRADALLDGAALYT